MLMEAVGRFAATDLRPAAHQAEESGELPASLIRKGWELGLLQASIPEAYGGFGDRSALTGALATEELAFGDLAGAFAIGLPSLFGLPILLGGTEEQKKRYLPQLVQAGWRPFTAALMEYAFDFDPNALRTSVGLKDDSYVLNGEKAFVPFAREAESILVYGNLDGRTQGFIVEKGTAGLSVSGEREKLMSLNALPLYRVTLDNVMVPRANRLGGAAGSDFAPILAAMRIAQSAAALGVARAAFEYSRDYAKEREAFGVKIAQKQAVAFMLAEMRTEIEASRLLVWEAAWMVDQGKEESFREAYLASVGSMDMAMMVTDRAVQILGGHGYIREHPVEMWMRNGRGFATLAGFSLV